VAQLKPLLALLAALSALPAFAQAPPDAPPGAQRQIGPATPTELLFDSIAVGNMDLVREAITRGANLNSRNVLGQRPVDLAIDVGRSDIAFLLLSLMRGGPGGQSAAPALPPPAAAPVPRRGTAETVAPPAPPRTATLWANDGGAPQPDIGFLGFDASRGDAARPAGVRAPAPAPRRGVTREPLGG
jgi:hypothetical protein